MKKLKSDPITQPDLIAFLDGHSDFAFEIKTLNVLIGLGFTCEHAGTYDDPATPYRARPRPAAAPRFSDYEHLARVKEWSAGAAEDAE
ncbi:MAG: hypothetical protein IH989_08260 [Planctomycetes bacterium]|nr:hypothetical protein [Planctomycetota bacterium]